MRAERTVTQSSNKFMMRTYWRWLGVAMLAVAWLVSGARAAEVPDKSTTVLFEAEQFNNFGGWVLDQQSMDQMGSPYLLAHGLGDPVADAVTDATFPAAGEYHVWVRTRDWVATWNVAGAPGKFQLLVDGKPLAVTFGTEGVAWHWQDGGTVTVGPHARLALHDLAGFEGRCDAIVFSKSPGFVPPNDLAELTLFRRRMLGLPDEPEEGGKFDLVVIGGGIAGTSAAVVAARLGLTVALIQDRPVLGGNGSSEVRVWPEGWTNQQPYPHVGDVVRELVPDKSKTSGNAKDASVYADQRKLDVVKAEPRITLMLEERVNAVEASGGRIRAVIAQHVRSGRRFRVSGTYFADCTGDATVGALGGADFDLTREDHMGISDLWGVQQSDKEEPFPKCLCEDHSALGAATTTAPSAAHFPRCPWAIDLSDKPFPGRPSATSKAKSSAPSKLGEWYWESGFDRDPINDVETIRDLNLRAMYGAWDALKNVDGLYPNYKIGWAAYIAGKRESRRLMGDVILTADDFRKETKFKDAAFPCSWSIDLHDADPKFASGDKSDAFIAQATVGRSGFTYKGPYWAPYRCLYSRNMDNLFMAGRDISVSHDGLGAVRVMRTCGMMGEVLGMAASIANAHQCTPRDVYSSYLPELQAHLASGVGR